MINLKYEIVLLKDITISLDNIRKPLNQQERNKMKAKGLYPYCGANGVLDYIDDYIFNEEILCVAEDGGSWGLNKKCSYIMNEPCWVNNHSHVLKPTSRVNIKYLYYYLNKVDLNKHISGTTRGKLTKKALESIKVILPSIKEQERIVKLLDTYRLIIEKREDQLGRLSELTQSVFLELFGDPVTNSRNHRTLPLRELGNIQTGNTPSRKVKEYYGDHIEWIKSDNINTPFDTLTRAGEFLSKIGAEKGRVAEAGSILVTCIAGSMDCIGNVAIADRKVAFNQQINAITPYDKVNLYFLYYQFKVAKKLIQKASTNSMKGMVSKSKFGEISFVVPNIKEQENFSKIYLRIERQRELLQRSLTKLNNSFNSILNEAF